MKHSSSSFSQMFLLDRYFTLCNNTGLHKGVVAGASLGYLTGFDPGSSSPHTAAPLKFWRHSMMETGGQQPVLGSVSTKRVGGA